MFKKNVGNPPCAPCEMFAHVAGSSLDGDHQALLLQSKEGISITDKVVQQTIDRQLTACDGHYPPGVFLETESFNHEIVRPCSFLGSLRLTLEIFKAACASHLNTWPTHWPQMLKTGPCS